MNLESHRRALGNRSYEGGQMMRGYLASGCMLSQTWSYVRGQKHDVSLGEYDSSLFT